MENKKRLVDVAFEILKKETIKNGHKEMDFFDLWEKVINVSGIGEEKAKEVSGQFFADLALDTPRFYSRDGKTWSLAEAHSSTEKMKTKTEFAPDGDDIIVSDDGEEEKKEKKETTSEEDD